MERKRNRRQKALVVGLGHRTGLASANFLCEKGYDVTVSDKKSYIELAHVIEKLNLDVRVLAGSQEPDILSDGYDLLVISPGVPKSIPLVAEAVKMGVRVISEIELAYENMKGRIIAITGTDGKSTTTTLTGHILGELGKDVLVGGNIGIPLISLVKETNDDNIAVVELSSFQLETIDKFRPHVCSILNVTPDHLDRYADMDEYFEAKFRITKNQQESDFYIYNSEDEMLLKTVDRAKAKRLSFSLSGKSADSYYEGGHIFLNDGNKQIKALDASRMGIFGIHNIQNAMASILMVSSILKLRGESVDYDKIAEACYTFNGLEHRMERVGEYEGRAFINDSKATTVGAVIMALKSLRGKGILILGGQTKGDDYSRLIPAISERVKGLVLMGESSEEFSKIFSRFSPVTASNLDDALIKAMKMSAAGDEILLSPACASYDMFNNYEERGRAFKDSYSRLSRGELSWI